MSKFLAGLVGLLVLCSTVFLFAQQAPVRVPVQSREKGPEPVVLPTRGAVSTFAIVVNPTGSISSPYAYRMDTRTGETWVLLFEAGSYRWMQTGEGPSLVVKPRPKR